MGPDLNLSKAVNVMGDFAIFGSLASGGNMDFLVNRGLKGKGGPMSNFRFS